MVRFICPPRATVRACVYACAVPEECTTSGDRHRVIARGFMGQSGQCVGLWKAIIEFCLWFM